MNKPIYNVKLSKGKNMHTFKRSFLIFGAVAILALFVAGCSSAAATPQATTTVTPVVLDNTVTAEGHLEPVTSTWLSFQASGRVEEVLVNEQQLVKQGQPIVRLEGSDRAETDLQAAKSAMFLAKQNLVDATNSDSMRASYELALANAQKAYNTALGDYWDRKKTQGSSDLIVVDTQKLQILDNHIDDLKTNYDNMSELADNDSKKALALQNWHQALIDRDALKKQLNYVKALPDSQDIELLLSKLDTAKATLSDAMRNYNRVKNGYTPEALAQLQTAADQAQAAEADAQWAYDQLVLTAPYDGTLVQCSLTKGQFVVAGQQVAQVADFSQWQVKTDDLGEVKMAQIDTSKPVSMTADALPGKTFTGTVENISQYYTDNNGDIQYTAKVKLDDTDPKLRWGMTMQVEFQK
jgi:multidrug resistance efflux pump